MYDPTEIRKLAQDCIEQAEEPCKSPSQQLALLRMATMLLEIADAPESINRLLDDAMSGTKRHLDS